LFVINRLVNYFRKKEQAVISKKSIAKEFGIVFLACLLVIHTTIVPMMIFTDNGMQLNDYVIGNIIPTLFVLLYFSIVRGNQYLTNYVKQKVQLEKITNDQLQTELKFLKAQYHPHFLFNALNTVYFQMDENVTEAKRTVEKFSELLRYQLYDQQQTVPISQEIHYLQNFIDIQKVRTSEKLQLKTYFDSSLNGQQVYPLLFLPLVENAFKYVGGDYKINIEARKEKDSVELAVMNSLPLQPLPQKENGIGLENLKRRLELLYPGKHELLLTKDISKFSASLKISLNG
jgi:two-component system, LytTR family, sensor kinase